MTVQPFPPVGFAHRRLREPRPRRLVLRMARFEPKCVADVHRAENPLGMLDAELQRLLRPTRQAQHYRTFRLRGIENGERQLGDRAHSMRLRVESSIGATVARPVERDDTEVVGQVRNLHLPETGVDDGPRRHEEQRYGPGTEDLVPHLYAVALYKPVTVGRTCTHDASFPRSARSGHGRASNTVLNGVSATRRNLVNPAAVTTSRMRVSPA